MKKLILAAMAVAMWMGVQAQGQVQERDYIEINARASREVTPDEIFLQIVLDQNETKGKYTIDQLESQLYQALKKAGVDAEKELRVSDMSSELKSFLLKKNEGRITKEFVLKVNNQQIMPVFRELDKTGITNVSIQSSRYSKVKELYDELLAEATVTAQKRASIMAQAIGQKAGPAIFIQTYDNTAAYDAGMASNSYAFKARAGAAPEPAPAFEFNKTRVEVSITARFRL